MKALAKKAVAAAAAAGLALTGGAVLAAPAQGVYIQCGGLCAGNVGPYSGWIAHYDWGGKQAQVRVVQMSNYGVSSVRARALCQRANGGTAWYESTIKAYYVGGYSHYDCGNNGTYDVALDAVGGDFS